MEGNRNSNPPQETPEITETPPGLEEEEVSTTPSRSKKWLIIGGALVIFLALAAFLGTRLLKPPAAAGSSGVGGMFFSSNGKSVRLSLIPAKEVPQQKADTAGLFVRRQDQSIFIGTGKVQTRVSPGASPSSSYDGPVVEVVTTHDTKIYQDITDMDPGNMDLKNGGQVKIQQVVKPGSLDDLGPNSMVSVWGEKQGDRYIAKVISFQ
jgi:hypothetical protein